MKPKNETPRGLRRLGARKISQQGTEFFHKIKEVHRHRTGGRRGNMPHRRG